MRRLLIALLVAAGLASTAQARVLVVMGRHAQDVSPVDERRHSLAMRAAVLGMLNRAGVEYDMSMGYQNKTEFCRLGVQTWNFGEANAYTTTYEAVIHILNGSMTAHGNGYRPDSLFSSTKMPRVPQLVITNSYSSLSSACACSLGVSRSAAGYNGGTNYIGWTQRYREASDIRYRSGFTDGMLAVANETKGTVRFLVSGGSNVGHAQTVLPTVPLPCMDCDSLLAPTPDDSGVVVVNHNSHWNPTACPTCSYTAKPIIICSGSHNADDQMDAGTMFMGLAYLDSLCGGTIIKKPLQMAINIRGGFRRNSPVTRGGMSPHDSVVFKASIDSIAALNVPFTVGVNIDSVGTYEAEKFWWLRSNRARFAPESWSAVNDTATSAFLNANFGQSVDIWGRFRSRRAVGPMTQNDTSLANLIKVSLFRTDSLFPNRLDKVGMAAAFDWGPRNIGSIGQDSLWFAIQRGGLSAIVFENNAASAPSQSRNPLGFMPQQTRMKSSLGGEPIRILGTPQSPDSGSVLVEGGMTTDSFNNSPANSWCKNLESFWSGMVGLQMLRQGSGGGHSYDSGPGAEFGLPANNFTRTSVLTIHAGDLGSGTRSDAASRPTRPGWWTVKSAVNIAKICNLLANRQVVQIKYTQDLDP